MLKKFIKYVSQNMLGMVGMSVYILADTYFISVAVGADGITALNLVLPIYNIIFAILFLPDRCWCNDLDSFLSTFYMTVKLLLPCLIPCHQCCFRFLHGDQQRVIKAVIMEL